MKSVLSIITSKCMCLIINAHCDSSSWKRILLAIILLLPLLVPAQEYQYIPFPDSGAVWSEMYNPPMDDGPMTYENFTLTGEDTLINELSYKKLYIFYDSVFNKSKARCVGGIREDEQRRVYFKGDSVIHPYKPMWITDPPLDEILLYDFSSKIGDVTFSSLNETYSL